MLVVIPLTACTASVGLLVIAELARGAGGADNCILSGFELVYEPYADIIVSAARAGKFWSAAVARRLSQKIGGGTAWVLKFSNFAYTCFKSFFQAKNFCYQDRLCNVCMLNNCFLLLSGLKFEKKYYKSRPKLQ